MVIWSKRQTVATSCYIYSFLLMDPWIVSLGMIRCFKQYANNIVVHDPIHHMNIPAPYLAGLDSATTGLPSQITFNTVTQVLFSDKGVQPNGARCIKTCCALTPFSTAKCSSHPHVLVGTRDLRHQFFVVLFKFIDLCLWLMVVHALRWWDPTCLANGGSMLAAQ